MKRAAYEPTSACETTDSRYRSSSPGNPSPNRNNPRRDFTTSPLDRTHFFNTPTRREWVPENWATGRPPAVTRRSISSRAESIMLSTVS